MSADADTPPSQKELDSFRLCISDSDKSIADQGFPWVGS